MDSKATPQNLSKRDNQDLTATTSLSRIEATAGQKRHVNSLSDVRPYENSHSKRARREEFTSRHPDFSGSSSRRERPADMTQRSLSLHSSQSSLSQRRAYHVDAKPFWPNSETRSLCMPFVIESSDESDQENEAQNIHALRDTEKKHTRQVAEVETPTQPKPGEDQRRASVLKLKQLRQERIERRQQAVLSNLKSEPDMPISPATWFSSKCSGSSSVGPVIESVARKADAQRSRTVLTIEKGEIIDLTMEQGTTPSPPKLRQQDSFGRSHAKPVLSSFSSPVSASQQLASKSSLKSESAKTGFDELVERLNRANEDRRLEEERHQARLEGLLASRGAQQDAASRAMLKKAEYDRKRRDAEQRANALIVQEEVERKRKEGKLAQDLRNELEKKRSAAEQEKSEQKECQNASNEERRLAMVKLAETRTKIQPSTQAKISHVTSHDVQQQQASKADNSERPGAEHDDDDGPIIEEPTEVSSYQSLSSKLRAEKGVAEALCEASRKQDAPRPCKAGDLPHSQRAYDAAKPVNAFAPKSLNSSQGTAAVASVNQWRCRSSLGKRTITAEDGQVWLWREQSRLPWPEILELFDQKFQHQLSQTTLRRRLDQFKNAIRGHTIGIQLIQKLAEGDEGTKELMNDTVLESNSLQTPGDDPCAREVLVGEITEFDAQVLEWRETSHQYYQGAYSWKQILEKLKYHGLRHIDEEILRDRYEQVRSALRDAKIGRQKVIDLSNGDERAKREVNQAVNGAWPIPGKSFWDEFQPSTKIQLIARTPEDRRHSLAQGQSHPEHSDTALATCIVSDEPPAERPVTGGKMLNAAFWRYHCEKVQESWEREQYADEQQQLSGPSDDEDQTYYYYYSLWRRELTAEECEQADDDEYDGDGDDRAWKRCGNGSEDLTEMNIAASQEIFKTVPGQPTYGSESWSMNCTRRSDRTLYYVLSKPEVGRVEVTVFKELRQHDERTLGPSGGIRVSRIVYIVKERKAVKTTSYDEVLGEAGTTSEKVVEGLIGPVHSDLDLANEAAIDHFANCIVRPKDARLGRLWSELTAKKEELRNGVVSMDMFRERVEYDQGNSLEVWVESIRLNGPTNI